MNRLHVSTLAALVLLAAAAHAQQPTTAPQPVILLEGQPVSQQQAPPDDPLARVLYPPELVMQHQEEIGLRPEQRGTITKAIQDFQAKVVDLQWRMHDESQRLVTLLEKPSVDQAAALTQVDVVLGVEREVKRAHLALLIQIKNVLTPEQQTRLAAARTQH